MYDKFLTKSLACTLLFLLSYIQEKGSVELFLVYRVQKYDILSFTVCVRVNERFFVYIVEKRTFTHSGVCVSGRIHLE